MKDYSGVILVISLIIVACLAVNFCLNAEELPPQIVYDKEIYSLTNIHESQISGSFFLGCGGISTSNEMYYYYYVEDTEYGGMVLEKSDMFLTSIIETNETPHVQRYNINYYDRKFVLYVPVDTVKIDFNVEV